MKYLIKKDAFEHLFDRYTHFEGLFLMIIILNVNLGRSQILPVGSSQRNFFQEVLDIFCKRPKHGIHPSRRMPIGMHPTFRLLSFKLF